MSVLDKYIARTIVSGTLMAVLLLVSLLSFLDFIDEVGNIGKGDYDIYDAIYYVVLSMPRQAYEVFPTAVLLGSLLSLGTLASNSELTVMRAAGISIARIVRSVLQAGLVLVLLVAFVGEVLVPIAERTAQSIKASAFKQKISLDTQHGFWARDGQKYIYVGRVYPDKQMGDVEIYELNEQQQLIQQTYARSASFQQNSWRLKQVRQSMFADNNVQTMAHQELQWDRLLNPDVFNIVSVKPQNMSVLDLYRYSQYLQRNELDASHFKLAFWIKVMTPLSSLVMVLIALPFVFGSQRSGSAGQRILIGLLLGIGFFMLNRTLNHLGQLYGFPPFVSVALPMMLAALAGIYAIRRVH